MVKINPKAIVDPQAELDSGVVVEDYAVIGRDVVIGKNTLIRNHVVITGRTVIGENNIIYPYAVLGTEPQDVTYRGETTKLIIGHNNLIREFVTVNTGTLKGDGYTSIGHNNLIMASCHIAHDCVLEDHIVMANSVLLGGHVMIESYVTLGGLTGLHHFVTVGKYAFVAGCSAITRDVPPFMLSQGNPARVRYVNVVGLKRNLFACERLEIIKEAFKMLYKHPQGSFHETLDRVVERWPNHPDIQDLVNALRESEKGRKGRAREVLRQISHSNPSA